MLVGNLETKTPAFYFYVNYLFGGSDLFQKNRDEIAQNPSDISKYAYMAVINRQSNQIIKQVRLDNGKDLWVRDFGIKLKEQEKLQRVLSSCFYTTTSLAKDEFLANNSNKDVEVGFVAYSSINDSSIEPTMQEIEAAYEGESFQIGFNARYLLDVLGVIDSDDIILECKNSMSPTIIKSSTDESFLSVIMPLRVEW